MEHLVKLKFSQFMTIATFDKKLPVLLIRLLEGGNPDSDIKVSAFALILSELRKPDDTSGDFRPYLIQ